MEELRRQPIEQEKAGEVPVKVRRGHRSAEELKAELDDLLDEIDGVLEENAEAFVSGYIQQGGE